MRANSKNPRSIKVQDKLIKFSFKSNKIPVQKTKPISDQDHDLLLQQQKARWFMAVGLSPTGKNTLGIAKSYPRRHPKLTRHGAS